MPSQPSAPRRTTSAAVYRRRRIVVAVALLLGLALVAGAVAFVVSMVRGGSGAQDPAPAAASSSAPAPSASPTSTEPPECKPSDLRLTAATDRLEYSRGQEAELSLEITNLSSTPCRRDVGTAQQEFLVRTGEGVEVFSTRTCQEGPTHQEMVLEPHRAQTAVYRWGGRQGLADCARLGELAAPGPHLLTVALGDITSRPVAFRITDEVVESARPTPAPTPTAAPGATPAPSGSAAPAPTPAPTSGASPTSGAPSAASSSATATTPAATPAPAASSPGSGRRGTASPSPVPTVTVTVSAPPATPAPSPSR